MQKSQKRYTLGVWLFAALGTLVIAAELLKPLMAGQAPPAAEGLADRQALATAAQHSAQPRAGRSRAATLPYLPYDHDKQLLKLFIEMM